jgi:uncharacterized membrane protein YdbT with pleckstrin-like domain
VDDLENTQTRRSLVPCELHNDLVERVIRVERDVLLLNRFFPDMQKQAQTALTSIADSNQRMAVHMEESKRQYERMDAQDDSVSEIKRDVILIERNVMDLKMQSQQLVDFTQGLKRFGWIVTTSILAVAVWAVQRWMESPR